MSEYEYDSKDVETRVASAIQAGEPFILKIRGWRRYVIGKGLQHYLRYLEFRRQGKNRLAALLIIPFGFVTPTFWVLCVKAEFEGMYPSVEASNDILVIRFEKPGAA